MTSKKALAVGFLSILLLALSGSRIITAQQDPFVRVEDGRFVLNGNHYYFTGANFWNAMALGSEKAGGDRQRLATELDALSERGLTNLRILASSEGMGAGQTVQPEPRRYNEDLLRGLDFLLAEMGRRQMKAVLVLNNFNSSSGGMAQYVSWTTGTSIPDGSEAQGSVDQPNYASRFYADFDAQRLYLDFVFELIHRINHITGVMYRDDPTIMAWQLANEPRGLVLSDEYVEWVDKAAGFIQLHDPNHLVSLGGAGKLAASDGTQFEWVSTSPYLDYITVHLWMEDWGWYEPQSAEAAFPEAVGRAMGYLADHVSLARAINKPMVLDAFGASRDGGSVDVSSTTTSRDRYFRMILETIFRLAEEGNVTAGSNVWIWAGTARQSVGRSSSSLGRYSIYDGDKSTLDVLSSYATMMNDLNVPLESPTSDDRIDGQ